MDTSEVTGELPAISPTHDTPAVTAVDTPSTSNPSATPAFPSSSETATTLAEGTINEAGPQTSENMTSIQEKELNSHQKSCKNDGVFVELKTNVNKLTTSQAELYIQHLQMARKQDQIEVRQDETKKALDEMKKTQSGINEKVEEMEVTKERLERVEELLLNHLSQIDINTVHNNSAHAIDPTISAKKQDVIIIGGDYSDEDIRPLDMLKYYSIS
ncbi:uncharacterized protein LOC114538443 [Dendronephthya gigantea]|uniref:uncharacterized protein LOC114538443 n=1 Tax=Dendronephthya gigantea TaxID=151771 RepID=UPI001069478A|nr:uncharacterized protein LOC114538443 [Dendronephthya gigantea]